MDKISTPAIESDPEVVRRLEARLAAKQIEIERSIVWAKDQLAAIEAQGIELARMVDEVGALLRLLDGPDCPPLRQTVDAQRTSEGPR